MNYTFFSWNVNGVRAAEKKGFLTWLESCGGDIVAIQETKADPSQVSWELHSPNGYQSYWNIGERKGYSGVATYTKQKPTIVHTGFGIKEFDTEGRILITEYAQFIFMNIYFPNGGKGPDRVAYKLRFYRAFLRTIQSYIDRHIPVIITGDVNTAYQEIDLARPKDNVKHSGFLPEERAGLQEFFDKGLIDTFRYLHPDTIAYSWWDMKTKARERGVGWRIDYFFVTADLQKHILNAQIHNDVMGSDHCPISLTISI